MKKISLIALLLLLQMPLALAFSDTNNHRNENAIDYLEDKGVVEGYTDGSYQPDNPINRAEFVKILIESKYPGEASGHSCFSDVGSDWYAKYVCFAEKKNIVDGYDDGLFRPGKEINFAEAVKVLLETYDIDVCESCYSVWYEPYIEAAEEVDLLSLVSTSPAHYVTRGEMAQLVYNVETYLSTEPDPDPVPTPDDSKPSVYVPSDSQCSSGFLYDEGICKAGSIDLNAPTDLDYYLSDEIYGTEIIWDDWMNYSAIQDVLDEIIDNSMNDYEKAEAIANWVHTSKDYLLDEDGSSPANNNVDFIDIFESSTGVCFDAATITTAMFRVAGIPAISQYVDFNHINNLFYYDEDWYLTDTTFCQDKTNCSDVTVYDSDFVQNEFYTVYSRAGHYENSDGEYCDGDFCAQDAFYWSRMMPINNDSGAELIFPSFQITPNTDDGVQISCYLQNKIATLNGGDWDLLGSSFQYAGYNNIGYAHISVPTIGRYEFPISYRYVCAETLSGDLIASYLFDDLSAGASQAVTYEDLDQKSGASTGDFNRIIEYLKETTEDLGIEIQYDLGLYSFPKRF